MIFGKAKTNPPAPGYWCLTVLDGKPVVKVACPSCKTVGYLENHSINGEGIVRPSVVCTMIGCEFHEYIMLADWS